MLDVGSQVDSSLLQMQCVAYAMAMIHVLFWPDGLASYIIAKTYLFHMKEIQRYIQTHNQYANTHKNI